MYFHIQLSNPKARNALGPDVSNVSDALEDIFPLDTEDAILNWNGTSIALSYKYDISVIFEDIIDMLAAIGAEHAGSYTVTWPSDTFHATWDISWADGRLACSALWQDVGGAVEETLNRKPSIEMDVEAFVSEWAGLLRKVLDVLDATEMGNADLSDMARLRSACAQFTGNGRLYGEGRA